MSSIPPGYDPMKPRFYIDKEGAWYQDGLQILHKRTYLHNCKNLHKDDEGRYYVDEGRGKVYAVVEDAPFVVRTVNVRDGRLYIVLNDETEELLDYDSLYLNNDNIPYTTIKNATFEARFTRPAYYELSKHIMQEGDEFYIEIGGVKRRIKSGG